MNFSFFYSKRRKGSAMLRGIQMAEYLKAKKNPKEGYENDVCIFVKIGWHDPYPKRTYLDIIDAGKWLPWLKSHPTIGVIATSKIAKEFLKEYLSRDDIRLIPHHHCNYERWVRPDREVKVVGIIGSKNAFRFPIEEFRKRLKDIGLELKFNYSHIMKKREEVVNFFKEIDIHVTWRIKASCVLLKNPLKLSNACSFGIPTVAYPERSFVSEYNSYFFPVYSIDEMIDAIKLLKNNHDLYRWYAEKGIKKAEEYHIENIAKLYRQL